MYNFYEVKNIFIKSCHLYSVFVQNILVQICPQVLKPPIYINFFSHQMKQLWVNYEIISMNWTLKIYHGKCTYRGIIISSHSYAFGSLNWKPPPLPPKPQIKKFWKKKKRKKRFLMIYSPSWLFLRITCTKPFIKLLDLQLHFIFTTSLVVWILVMMKHRSILVRMKFEEEAQDAIPKSEA